MIAYLIGDTESVMERWTLFCAEWERKWPRKKSMYNFVVQAQKHADW